MAKDIKDVVSKENTFDSLEIRIGRVIEVEEEPSLFFPIKLELF